MNESNYNELKAKYEKLEIEHKQLKADFETVENAIVKLLKMIGVIPYKPGMNVLSAVLKKATWIGTQAMINPESVKKEFSFIADLEPIATKFSKPEYTQS